jgi:peptidoglycan/LPS O-acetylase OafA/YrhL
VRSLQAASGETRFHYLDGLRGIACLIVALCHFVIAFYVSLMDGDPAHVHNAWELTLAHTNLILFYDPGLGVAIFFVLSGYVLAASVAHVQPAWLRLALRRWLRLCLPVFPLACLALLAFHAGAFSLLPKAAHLADSYWLSQFYPSYISYYPLSAYVYNICVTFFVGYPGPTQSLLGTLWTLPFELVGSLGLYALYCLGADVFRRIRGCLAVSVLLIAVTWQTQYYGFGLGIALFECGRAITYLPARWRARLARAAAPAGWAALALGIWAGATPPALTPLDVQVFALGHRLGIPLGVDDMTHAGAALIVAAALLLRPFQRLLETSLCQYFGRISFMLYLVQNPVECSIGVYAFLHGGHDYNQRALVALVVYLAASIALADLATRLFDRPAIRLSRLAMKGKLP